MQQLSLAVEKLTQQVAAQRAALDAEITDTQVCWKPEDSNTGCAEYMTASSPLAASTAVTAACNRLKTAVMVLSKAANRTLLPQQLVSPAAASSLWGFHPHTQTLALHNGSANQHCYMICVLWRLPC